MSYLLFIYVICDNICLLLIIENKLVNKELGSKKGLLKKITCYKAYYK